jgi:2-oxoglutarate ferredoxin oxidoreductase subunit alpha
VGLFRPITASPFPTAQIAELAKHAQGILVVEMNTGQMLEDIRKVTRDVCPIEFFARMGGIVPFPDEILTEIHRLVREPKNLGGDPRLRWLQRHRDGILSFA